MAAINVVIEKNGDIPMGGAPTSLPSITGCCWRPGALLVIGFLMVYSTTFDLGDRFGSNPVYFVMRQLARVWPGPGGDHCPHPVRLPHPALRLQCPISW